MTDAIIEAAARALADADIYDTPTMREYSEMAEAVLAAVTPLIEATALERAAKLVEDEDGSLGGWPSSLSSTADLADAIRALKEQP